MENQENQSLTVSENVLNMELECSEHSDKFISLYWTW